MGGPVPVAENDRWRLRVRVEKALFRPIFTPQMKVGTRGCRKSLIHLVGGTGFEPVTLAV